MINHPSFWPMLNGLGKLYQIFHCPGNDFVLRWSRSYLICLGFQRIKTPLYNMSFPRSNNSFRIQTFKHWVAKVISLENFEWQGTNFKRDRNWAAIIELVKLLRASLLADRHRSERMRVGREMDVWSTGINSHSDKVNLQTKRLQVLLSERIEQATTHWGVFVFSLFDFKINESLRL